MIHKLFFAAFLAYIELLAFPALSPAVNGSQKLRVGYAAFTGAYAPIWIAVEENLGRKHGLELEAIYGGRISPGLLLQSGEVQYAVQTGFGTVQSYARGRKESAIIATFANTTGFSIYSKPQITKSTDLKGKVIAAAGPGDLTATLLRYVLKNNLNLDPGREVKIVRFGEQPDILPALEKGVVDAAILATPPRLMAKKMGFRELIDLDELGVQIPYVGVSTLKANAKRSPDTTVKLVATLIDAIHAFKTDREKSLLVMKKYLRGVSEEMLGETYGYFSTRTQKSPYPSMEAIKTALDVLADESPQARNVDPREVADLSFVKQAEGSRSR
jgi:ABC-type nitrate/sulfonate/bicarbonate transport system substrate-binding protein